jgi:hypothetical protein
MHNSDVQCNTASATEPSAEELEKQQRKQRRQKFLDRIRGRLSSVVHQLAFSPAEAAVACGKSPTWAYRKIYSGEWRVISSDDGRISIPRSELEHYFGGAEKYNPQPKHPKNGGAGN